MEFCLGDRLFVALAKRVGFPSLDSLRHCREIQLEWEDEVSEVFEVKATWGDADRHTQSATELGLEDDPLKGVFEALDAQTQPKAPRKKRTGESRLGGLVHVFDEEDSGDLDAKGGTAYTEDEVLEILDTDERVRSTETRERNWRDTWGEDNDDASWRGEESRPPVEAVPGRRRRSSRRLAASSGAGRPLGRRATLAPAPRRRRNRF